MTTDNNMGSYLDSISASGIAAAAQESKRMAQALEDERVAAEKKRIWDMNMKRNEEARKEQEKADAEKRGKLQAESDAIVQAQLEDEKNRAQREWRGVTGSNAGFDEYWKATAMERAAKKIEERRASVVSARRVWDGDIGPRARFSPVDFPR